MALLLTWALLAAVSDAQSPIRLISELDHEFLQVHSLLELDERRVLLTDSKQRALFLVNLSPNGLSRIGGNGGGPNEYRSPGQLLALAGDTVLMFDRQDRRVHRIVGERLLGALDPVLALGLTSQLGILGGADTSGHVLLLLPRPRRSQASMPPDAFIAPLSDSLFVVRVSLNSPLRDTIAVVAGPFRESVDLPRRTEFGPMTYVLGNPLSVADQASIAPDGQIWLLRAARYELSQLSSLGRRKDIYRAPGERPRTNDREQAFATSRAYGWIPGGPPSHSVFRNWPDHVPAIEQVGLLARPKGRGVVVLRRPSVDQPNVIVDVFDSGGVLTASFALPTGVRIVGVGRDRLYAVRVDPDGFERLQLFALQ